MSVRIADRLQKVKDRSKKEPLDFSNDAFSKLRIIDAKKLRNGVPRSESCSVATTATHSISSKFSDETERTGSKQALRAPTASTCSMSSETNSDVSKQSLLAEKGDGALLLFSDKECHGQISQSLSSVSDLDTKAGSTYLGAESDDSDIGDVENEILASTITTAQRKMFLANRIRQSQSQTILQTQKVCNIGAASVVSTSSTSTHRQAILNELNAEKMRNDLLAERKERLNERKVIIASEKPRIMETTTLKLPSLSRQPSVVPSPSLQLTRSLSPRKMMTPVDIKRAMKSIHADKVDQKVERSKDPTSPTSSLGKASPTSSLGKAYNKLVINSGLVMGSDAKSTRSSLPARNQWHGTIMKVYSDFMDIPDPVPDTKMCSKKTSEKTKNKSQVRAGKRTVSKNTDTKKNQDWAGRGTSFKNKERQSSEGPALSCTSNGILTKVQNSAADGLKIGKERLRDVFQDIIASCSTDSSGFSDSSSAYTGNSSCYSQSSDEDSRFDLGNKNPRRRATKQDGPLELFTCF